MSNAKPEGIDRIQNTLASRGIFWMPNPDSCLLSNVLLKVRGTKGVMKKGATLRVAPFGNSGLSECYHTRRVLKISTMTTITRTAPMAITTHTHIGVAGAGCAVA